jgi:predicted Zn-dependent peptidase
MEIRLQNTYYSLHLPNGLTVVAEHLPAVRSAAFQFVIPAGAITDPDGHEGSCGVLEGLMYRGAGERNSRELSDALDRLGVQRGGGAELETASFGGSLLADDLEAALEIYADILLRPKLPATEVQAERALALQKLERLEDSPAEKLFVHLRKAYYPGSYGRTPLGTEQSLRALSAETLAADHARRYRPNGSILAIAGRFSWGRLNETIHHLFGEWEGDAPPLPEPDTTGREKYLHYEKDSNQEQIGLMYPAVPVGHPQFYDMRMAMEVLSGGMAARLFTEVREKRGLCYTVRASASAVKGNGAIVAYAGTTPERCQETLDVTIAELRRLVEGVTDDELARARVGVLSSLVMQCEATRSRALSLARDQFLLGEVRTIEEIRAGVNKVTTSSIQTYLEAHPAQDFTIVTLGPKKLEINP